MSDIPTESRTPLNIDPKTLREMIEEKKIREVLLQYHNDDANSHKYYALYPLDQEGLTICKYGRVGRPGTTVSIRLQETWGKIYDKMKKGYILTGFRTVNDVSGLLEAFIHGLGGASECDLPE
jgi:predicted DNA-binding WGR domain protein